MSQPWAREGNQFLGNHAMNVSELSGNATASTLLSLPLGNAGAACTHVCHRDQGKGVCAVLAGVPPLYCVLGKEEGIFLSG